MPSLVATNKTRKEMQSKEESSKTWLRNLAIVMWLMITRTARKNPL